MAKLVDRLKSLKSLKHLVVETDSRVSTGTQALTAHQLHIPTCSINPIPLLDSC